MAKNEEKSGEDFLKTVNDFVDNLSTKEKISYGLITLGVILIIVGVILW
ncbi:MAG: hypothetical protein ACP5N3_05105 [Candidatus Nanoarchaeia archaeon]